MAKVEMDLAELKQLENKIEALEKEKQDLIDRQHQVVVHHKYFNGTIRPNNKIKSPYLTVTGVQYDMSIWRATSKYFEKQFSLTEALNSGYVEIDLTEDSSRHTKDYINMSEAISQIHQEEKEKLINQIDSSNQRAINAELQLETLSQDHIKELTRLKKEKDEEIQNLKKEKDEEIQNLKDKLAKLSEEFEDFKSNKKRVSLEEELISLKTQLEEYKNKSFWQRVFNK